jgi:hypothetical protein
MWFRKLGSFDLRQRAVFGMEDWFGNSFDGIAEGFRKVQISSERQDLTVVTPVRLAFFLADFPVRNLPRAGPIASFALLA